MWVLSAYFLSIALLGKWETSSLKRMLKKLLCAGRLVSQREETEFIS